MNSVNLVGRITSNVKLQHVGSKAEPKLMFTMSVNNKSKSKTSNVPVECWYDTAKYLAQHARKGVLISVVGEVQTNSWTDHNEKMHFSTNIRTEQVKILESKEVIEARENEKNNQKTI